MMDERTRRIGRNEALFRQVNEEVEGLERGLAEISDGTIHIVCECGDLICQKRLIVPISEYETVRADPTLFFVIAGHEKPSAEDVIETRSDFNVVRKHPGGPEQIARATDPRQ
jgi:hypothetical protein